MDQDVINISNQIKAWSKTNSSADYHNTNIFWSIYTLHIWMFDHIVVVATKRNTHKFHHTVAPGTKTNTHHTSLNKHSLGDHFLPKQGLAILWSSTFFWSPCCYRLNHQVGCYNRLVFQSPWCCTLLNQVGCWNTMNKLIRKNGLCMNAYVT